MRRRFLLSALAAAAVALVLLGVPLAVAVQTLLRDQLLDGLAREVQQVALVVDRRARTVEDAAILLSLLSDRSGARYTLLRMDGGVVFDTGGAAPGTIARPAEVIKAVRDGAGSRVGDDVAAAAVRVPETELVLRVAVPDAGLNRDIRRAWVAIGGLALTALGAAALLARRQSEQLIAPLDALAGSARRLGDGDFTARAPRAGAQELDAVAAALDSTAERLGATVERSRSFAADASHQLRTPLTALRLDLEALQATGAAPELVQAAIIEAERLEATVEELRTLAEPAAGEELVDLGALAASRLDPWQALARAQGRRIVLQAIPVPPVRARPAALGQSLQVLLDNALRHGAGTITVSVQPVSGGARLCVADEGPGVPEERESGLLDGDARGRGLPLARSLIEAEGGRLRLERARPGAMLCVVLPAATHGDGEQAHGKQAHGDPYTRRP